MFRALLVGDIRRLYDTARAEQHGRPLNIVLTCAVPWVAALPWEFAFDPVRRKYLASEEVHFTRGVMAAVPAEVIRTKSQRLRILVVGAQPRDVTPLSIAEEEQRLRHAFHALTDEGLAEIETLLDASPAALHEYLFREQIAGRSFDIVHFISHGEFAPGADEGRLLFTGRDGWQQEVEVRPLREMLCSRGIHLVFLNACESGTGWKPSGGTAGKASRRSRERGVAQALVEGGLPAVVANQYTVLDSSAVAFSECFYRALALGASLGQAAREARIALNYAVDGEAIDWAVPVLYARDPEVRLCPGQAHGSGALPPARAVAVRRSGPVVPAADGWRIRVAVADISRYFPQLDALLVSMNKAQECFEFVTAEVTIPLGVWEQYEDKETGERTRYLHAQRFARKVKAQPQRLGVDFLFCVTNHWMRDGDFYNLYGWWSSDRDCRVLLFSTQGLSLPAEGTAAGRVVANAVVQTLAAQMAEEMQPKPLTKPAIHEKGAADCPFFGNVERTSDIIAGRLKFDTLCKKYLRTHLPERFGNTNRTEIIRAFDQLLRAF